MQFYQKREQKNVALWCFFITFCIFLMCLLGAITRLTGSGLSIVQWQPISGILPPSTENHWQELFRNYQNSVEFQQVNSYFSLKDFKSIFWLEYIHRLWGRAIGLFFILPFLYFLWKNLLSRKDACLLFLLFLGGIFQGAVGWYMVKSGLTLHPWVSPLRLAFHLSIAAFLMCGFFIFGLKFLKINSKEQLCQTNYPTPLIKLTFYSFLCTFFFGALVAGNKAGLIYNTFPKMGNNWMPEDLWTMNIWWKNFFYNPSMVQFIHRLLAITTLVLSFITGFKALKIDLLPLFWSGSIFLQFLLGIITLLCHTPLFVATVHQGWALLTLMLGTFLFKKATSYTRKNFSKN